MVKRSYTSRSDQQSSAALPSLEFDLDGVTWVCESAVSILDLSEYARLAQRGVDAESPEGMAILADVYSGLLGDQTYQRFRAHCRKNRTDGQILVQILGDLITDGAERPTQRPSDSSAGPATAPATAKVVSLSRGTVEEVPIEQVQQQETETVPTPAAVSYG
ncbi:hypothetical protein [Nonomuraea sp. 10N515B]|uniref:hypothetical protein n=1 Tax=Nonomuraea sp. 10N515B TaxID=3457422 RepID=UPI003FCD0213